MKAARIAIAVLSVVAFAGLFLPCARVSHQESAPVPPVVAVHRVGTWLLDDVPRPYAVYLLSVAPLSMIASVFLLGTRVSPRAAAWAGLGGAAYLLLPNVSVPQVKLGALTAWHWTLEPFLQFRTKVEILYGFDVYVALIVALAVAYAALAVAGCVALRGARRGAKRPAP